MTSHTSESAADSDAGGSGALRSDTFFLRAFCSALFRASRRYDIRNHQTFPLQSLGTMPEATTKQRGARPGFSSRGVSPQRHLGSCCRGTSPFLHLSMWRTAQPGAAGARCPDISRWRYKSVKAGVTSRAKLLTPAAPAGSVTDSPPQSPERDDRALYGAPAERKAAGIGLIIYRPATMRQLAEALQAQDHHV